MSYCKELGKDQVIFLTEEDAAKPSSVELPEPAPGETPQGLITESGEINWSCPCLGGMAVGPCGVEFREAFSCFHYSEAEPKGSDCFDKFVAMQECMKDYPELYDKSTRGGDGDDDDDDLPQVRAAADPEKEEKDENSGEKVEQSSDKVADEPEPKVETAEQVVEAKISEPDVGSVEEQQPEAAGSVEEQKPEAAGSVEEQKPEAAGSVEEQQPDAGSVEEQQPEAAESKEGGDLDAQKSEEVSRVDSAEQQIVSEEVKD